MNARADRSTSATASASDVPQLATTYAGGALSLNRLGRIASVCYDHRRRVLTVWILLLVVLTGAGRAAGGEFKDRLLGGNTESEHARSLLAKSFPAESGDAAEVVFHADDAAAAATVIRSAADATVARLRGADRVAAVRGPFGPGASGQVSADGRTAYAVVQFDATSDDLPAAAIKHVMSLARADQPRGVIVELGGAPIAAVDKAKPGASEGIGILAAVVILLLAFGSVIAMGLPIATALFGIVIAFGALDLLSHAFIVPTFGGELAALIGLGAGIDYALFITTRYRQGLGDGLSPRDAVGVAMATSGRAVFFAGCTVVISLFGLFLLGLTFVYGLALGAIAGVVLVLGAAITLLPALLGFVGNNVDRLHVPRVLHRGRLTAHRHTLAWRWSRIVQRRAGIAGAAALLGLLALALPLLSMRLAFGDAGNASKGLTTRRAYDLLAENFGRGTSGPLVVTVKAPTTVSAALVDRLRADVSASPGVAGVAPTRVSPRGDVAVITVVPTTSSQDEQTQNLVHHLRSDVIPRDITGSDAAVFVGGLTAAGIDASHQYSTRLPVVIGAVVVLSFLLLLVVFRSIAVPLKAVVMNLLSIGAAYGVMVAVFQWGWLKALFNVSRTGPIDPWIPVMLFTILFGLSMDYEVFLLSRIREEWLDTGDNATAVADGLAATARLITAAAAIMVCVFGSFVVNDVRPLKIIGLGLASAVFFDATLVRMVLVPSTMELLGRANWWFPRWLERSIPHIAVDSDPVPIRVASDRDDIPATST